MRETRSLKKIYVDGWAWHISDPEILNPWFPEFKKYLSFNKVKSNELRDVFRVEANAVRYYVKYNRPISLFLKLRSCIIPQAKLEFSSAQLLSSMDIPVVEMCGWAKKGAESLLISRELEDAENARDFWFASAIENESEKKRFLDSFADFLKRFLSSGIYHPDFHLGNLLFRKKSGTFIFVDPYGIKKLRGCIKRLELGYFCWSSRLQPQASPEATPRRGVKFELKRLHTNSPRRTDGSDLLIQPLNRLNKSQKLRMLKVIGALRGELSDSEAVSLLKKLDIFEEPQRLWLRILQLCGSEAEKLWGKRREQILSGNSKYCMEMGYPDFSCLVRKSMLGVPFLTDGQLKDIGLLSAEYDLEECCRAKAEFLWLKSFKYQFHRIRHRMPLAWIKKEQGNDILICQRIRNFEEPDESTLKEFVRRCEFSGIKIEGLKKNIKRVNGDLMYDIQDSDYDNDYEYDSRRKEISES